MLQLREYERDFKLRPLEWVRSRRGARCSSSTRQVVFFSIHVVWHEFSVRPPDAAQHQLCPVDLGQFAANAFARLFPSESVNLRSSG